MENTNPKTDIGYIYALCDPTSGLEMYIGQAFNVQSRYDMHLWPSKLRARSIKNSWIKSLLSKSLLPQIKILKVVPRKDLNITELETITKYRNINPNLKNSGRAGIGGVTHDPIKKPVKCYHMDNPKELLYFDSIKECAEFIKIRPSSINKVINITHILRPLNNYAIAYIENEFPTKVFSWKKDKPLNCSNGIRYKNTEEVTRKLNIPLGILMQYLRKSKQGKAYSVYGLKFWFDEPISDKL